MLEHCTPDSKAESSRDIFDSLLLERLSIVAKEYHDWVSEQEHAELESLRREVTELQGKVSRLNQELTSTKTGGGFANLPKEGILDLDIFLQDMNGAFASQFSAEAGVKYNSQETPIVPAEPASSGPESNSGEFTETERVPPLARARSCLKVIQSGDDLVSSEKVDLEKKFRDLDLEHKGYIDTNRLANELTKQIPSESDEKENQMHRYRVAVLSLNKQLGMYGLGYEKASKVHINFRAFEVIMNEENKNLQTEFGAEVAEALMEIREAMVHDVIVQEIAKTWRIRAEEVEVEESVESRKKRLIHLLEPISAAMICLNALLIGISLDASPEWNGWFVIEVFFCCFFVGELLTNCYAKGCGDYFFGHDWVWSWFDLLIVCSAVFDLGMSVLNKFIHDSDGNNNSYIVLVIRLVRLIRVTRLLRILRLKVFKELTLMVNGVVAGLKTLFWAIVLLALFMYVIGVLMRQLMDREAVACDSIAEESAQDCNRGKENLTLYGEIMFGSVPRSMIAMFTCFTEGCSSPDGTPFIWHLWDTRGPVLVVGYVLAFMFISFGVFNLILAVFVEVTLANAKQHDAERQYSQQEDHVTKAHQLHKLLGKLCKAYDHATQKLRARSRKIGGLKGAVQKYRKKKNEDSTLNASHLHMKISQDQFEEIINDAEVMDILDDLDISSISRQQLFDILDADGNGFLSISEVVDGIMKLRGPADKGDVVATSLCLRQLQKQVGRMEERLQKQGKTIDALSQQIKTLAILSPSCTIQAL